MSTLYVVSPLIQHRWCQLLIIILVLFEEKSGIKWPCPCVHACVRAWLTATPPTPFELLSHIYIDYGHVLYQIEAYYKESAMQLTFWPCDIQWVGIWLLEGMGER